MTIPCLLLRPILPSPGGDWIVPVTFAAFFVFLWRVFARGIAVLYGLSWLKSRPIALTACISTLVLSYGFIETAKLSALRDATEHLSSPTRAEIHAIRDCMGETKTKSDPVTCDIGAERIEDLIQYCDKCSMADTFFVRKCPKPAHAIVILDQADQCVKALHLTRREALPVREAALRYLQQTKVAAELVGKVRFGAEVIEKAKALEADTLALRLKTQYFRAIGDALDAPSLSASHECAPATKKTAYTMDEWMAQPNNREETATTERIDAK